MNFEDFPIRAGPYNQKFEYQTEGQPNKLEPMFSKQANDYFQVSVE